MHAASIHVSLHTVLRINLGGIEMNSIFNSASLILTEKCNLSCKYCFECYERNMGPDMSEEVVIRSIDFLFEQAKLMQDKKCVNITLFGGEPFLKPKLCDFIINYGVKKREETGIQFTANVITNGTIMSDEIELLIRRWRNKINFSIQVSIDGCQEAQDLYRVKKDGSSSFDMVAKNIPVFNDIDPNFCLHGCLNKLTLPLLFKSYKFFVEEFKHKTNIWFMPIHSEEWDETDVKIYDEQLRQIFEFETGILKTVSSFIPIDKLLSSGGCRSHPNRTCGAGTSYISITGNGDIYPCHNFYFSKEAASEDYKLGNIFDTTPITNEEILQKFTNCCVATSTCHDCENVACYRCLADNWRFGGDINTQIGKTTTRCKLSSVEHKWQLKAVEWANKNAIDRKTKEFLNNTQKNGDMAFVLKQMAEGLNDLNTRLLRLEHHEAGLSPT